MQAGEIGVLAGTFAVVAVLAWLYLRKLRRAADEQRVSDTLSSGLLLNTLLRMGPERWQEMFQARPDLVTEDRTDFLLQQCGQYLLHGQISTAERLCDAAAACWSFRGHPAWTRALSLADFQRRLGRLDQAAETYLQLEKHATMEVFVRSLRGWLYLLEGRPEAALECIRTSWDESEGEHPGIRSMVGVSLGVAALACEEWDLARIGISGTEAHQDWASLAEPLRSLQSALQTEDNHGVADSYLLLAEQFFAQRSWFQSLYCYQQAVRYNPENLDAVRYLGDGYFAQAMTLESVEWYQRAIALRPDAPAYRFLGHAYARLGRLDDAIQATEAALRIRPEYAEAADQLRQLREIRDEGGLSDDPMEWPG